ncbi:MAG: allantoate amidohydrolase [Pseudonocardiales bacterium]
MTNFDRAWDELAPLGRDPLTGGYQRYAWTDVDEALRAWFRAQAEARTMQVEVDRNGNQWAWWRAPGPGAVVTGSHLDSVPGGGAYDGPLGVVSGFLAIDELLARRVDPVRPIAVVQFADEEGARFGVSCVGSRLMTGLLAPEQARALHDADGLGLADAMSAAGVPPELIGRDEEALARIGAFVELHIEQGRGLVDVPAPIGVARRIWPHGRWRVTFTGSADHAGTTRLPDRHDPMLPFAMTVLAARRQAELAGALATFGKVRVQPGATNGIASSVEAWLDVRAPDESTLIDLVDALTQVALEVAAAHGSSFDIVCESRTAEVAFDAALRDRVQSALAARLGKVPGLSTGAGHDAGIVATAVPTAMLFVRNRTGVSHSPAEHADRADCLDGVLALADVLADLAC